MILVLIFCGAPTFPASHLFTVMLFFDLVDGGSLETLELGC